MFKTLNVAGRTRGINGSSLRKVSIENTLRQYEESIKNKNIENLAVIDNYGFIVNAYQGNKNHVGYAAELTSGKIVTHNHTGRYGGSFSKNDILAFLEYDQQEMRVCAKEGTYSLKELRKGSGNKKGLKQALIEIQPALARKADKAFLKVKNEGGNTTTQRKAYVDIYHKWYVKNLSKYGYAYKFEESKKRGKEKWKIM